MRSAAAVILFILAPLAGGCGGGGPSSLPTDGAADRTTSEAGTHGPETDSSSDASLDTLDGEESSPDAPGGSSPGDASDGGGAACATNAECGPALYCQREHCADEAGACAPEPSPPSCVVDAAVTCFDSGSGSTCVVNAIQACGCDHVTYENDCAAASLGVNVDFEGQCPP